MSHFVLKMHQIWHMSFVWQFQHKNFVKFFSLKLSYKNLGVKIDAFQDEMVILYVFWNETLWSESVNWLNFIVIKIKNKKMIKLNNLQK